VVTTRIGRVAESHAMQIGEAARLVMPGTCEGIGFAMENGVLGARFLAKHFDPSRGFSRMQQERYRLACARAVLPKFVAGEGFVRLMRSTSARGVMGRLLDRRVRGAIETTIAKLL